MCVQACGVLDTVTGPDMQQLISYLFIGLVLGGAAGSYAGRNLPKTVHWQGWLLAGIVLAAVGFGVPRGFGDGFFNPLIFGLPATVWWAIGLFLALPIGCWEEWHKPKPEPSGDD